MPDLGRRGMASISRATSPGSSKKGVWPRPAASRDEPGKHAACPRRLAAVEEQQVAAPPEPRSAARSSSCPSWNVYPSKAASAGRTRARPRSPRASAAPPRPACATGARRAAPSSMVRPTPVPASASAARRAGARHVRATGPGRAGRSAAPSRSRSPRARSRWPTPRRRAGPARGRWPRPSSCRPRAGGRAPARRRRRSNASAYAPTVGSTWAASGGDGRTRASPWPPRRSAVARRSITGRHPCQWWPIPWMSTSGSPLPAPVVVHRSGRLRRRGPHLAELLGPDRAGGAHVLDHEPGPVVHDAPAPVEPVPVPAARPHRVAQALLNGLARRRLHLRAHLQGRARAAGRAQRVHHVAHLRLDHHDDRPHAEVRVRARRARTCSGSRTRSCPGVPRRPATRPPGDPARPCPLTLMGITKSLERKPVP